MDFLLITPSKQISTVSKVLNLQEIRFNYIPFSRSENIIKKVLSKIVFKNSNQNPDISVIKIDIDRQTVISLEYLLKIQTENQNIFIVDFIFYKNAIENYYFNKFDDAYVCCEKYTRIDHKHIAAHKVFKAKEDLTDFLYKHWSSALKINVSRKYYYPPDLPRIGDKLTLTSPCKKHFTAQVIHYRGIHAQVSVVNKISDAIYFPKVQALVLYRHKGWGVESKSFKLESPLLWIPDYKGNKE